MSPASETLLDHVHWLVTSLAPDAVLLDRFCRSQDEAAFTNLVARHGPLVWRVCRRVLADPQAAEDAFQATFLVLARRARAIRKPSSLAAWLHGVAFRVALNLKTTQAQHNRRETPALDLDLVDRGSDPLAEVSAREALLILDEEVQRLPEQNRLPVILCCLEGLSQEEAARRLGWSAGSVKGRLERGRKRLQTRLIRRGLTLTTVLGGMALSHGLAAAGCRRMLVAGAVRTVMAFTKGETGQVAAKVSALADFGLKGLALTQAKITMALILTAGLVVAGMGAIILPGFGDHPTPQEVPLVDPGPGANLAKDTGPPRPPRSDLYGDPLPKGAVARLGTERFRGDTWVERVTVVPGGIQFLGRGAGSVILWDATTGKEVRRFRAPTMREMVNGWACSVSIESYAVSPDGKILAAGTVDHSGLDCPILLFDLANGQKLGALPGHKGHKDWWSANRTLAFATPELLVSGGVDGSIRVWETTAKREVRRLETLETRAISELVPFPDGKRILGCGLENKTGCYWVVWDVGTGKILHQVVSLPGGFVKAALTPDGRLLAITLGVGEVQKEGGYNEVRLYSASDWKEQRRWRTHAGSFPQRNSVAFSQDRKRIATGGADQKVRRWELATGTEIAPTIEPYWYANNVAYLDAGTLMTCGSQHAVKFWDAFSGKPKLDLVGSETHLTALGYSPDGRHVVTGGGGGDATLRVWEVATGQQVARLRDQDMKDVTCVQFSPDGQRIASADSGGVARLWDWGTGREIGTFRDHQPWLHSVAFSPDGKQLATGDRAGVVRVWDVGQSKAVHTFHGHTAHITALRFSPDGRTLFSGSWDWSIRHWDLATGKEIRVIKEVQGQSRQGKPVGHTLCVTSLALSPGGQWLYSGSLDHRICAWDTSSGRLICVLKGVEKGYSSVNAIALSPDGTRLAAALGDEGENSFVHLWDILSGVKVGVFRGHRGGVTQLAFSPDGLHLASTSVDTTVVIWNVTDLPAVPPVKDGKEVATLWDDLGSGDPEVSYTAACRGAQAGDTAVNVLKTRLKPVASVAPAKVAELVRQLDAEVFADRERASRALRDLGPGVGHLLRKTVKKNESAEVRNRVEAILSLFAAEHCRSAQALEMLEMIGTQKAMQLLQDLAGGAADARLTQDAADALKRLKGRQTPRNRT